MDGVDGAGVEAGVEPVEDPLEGLDGAEVDGDEDDFL